LSGLLIGVISDTHGLVREEALKALKGTDVIFHGGDIGSIEVLNELTKIAPVVAVRGNCDRAAWSRELPVSRSFELGQYRFLIIHKLQDLEKPPGPLDAVIFGHSHQAKAYVNEQILYVNPGSAGPKRFRLRVTVARLRIGNGQLTPEIIELL
jgi:putative phosphoesterase